MFDLNYIKGCFSLVKSATDFVKSSRSEWITHKQNFEHVSDAKKALGIDFLDNREYSIFTNATHMYLDNNAPLPNTEHVQNLLVSPSLSKDKIKEFRVYESLFDIPTNINAYIVGSPTTEKFSQYIFGYQLEDEIENEEKYQTFTGMIDFPYRWVLNRERVSLCEATHYLQRNRDTGEITYRRIYADEKILPNWKIELDKSAKKVLNKYEHYQYDYRYPFYFTPGESSFPINGEYMKLLSRDYLLITRMPNILSQKAVENNRLIISVAGTHGMGCSNFLL